MVGEGTIRRGLFRKLWVFLFLPISPLLLSIHMFILLLPFHRVIFFYLKCGKGALIDPLREHDVYPAEFGGYIRPVSDS